MYPNKKMVRAVFMAFCFMIITLSSYAVDYCPSSAKGQIQYMPDGYCNTKYRTCCANGQFSGWNESCPPERKYKAVKRTRYTYVMPCSGNTNCPVEIMKDFPSYTNWFSAAALKGCDSRTTESECLAGSEYETVSDPNSQSKSGMTFYCNYGTSSSCQVPNTSSSSLYTLPECLNISQSAADSKCASNGKEGDICIHSYGYNGRVPQTVMFMRCHWTYSYNYPAGMKCQAANYSFMEFSYKLATTRDATVYECVLE